MNVQAAADQLEALIRLYLQKDEAGWVIPPNQQRAPFLEGPPGVGKTALVYQVASKLHLPIVSYSITHHTRQSAMGLPRIVEKTLGGLDMAVTEYTMSEILEQVYETIERSGQKEGLLFLDEITCVSETLSPVLLQFFQYKEFGGHRLPDGWVLVTAGNPPGCNRAARALDQVTRDRMVTIPVDGELESWLPYAREAGIHPAVTAYLEGCPDHFQRCADRGEHFVTPRSWTDLGKILAVWNGPEVSVELVGGYLRDQEIAQAFTAFYWEFTYFEGRYQVEDILSGRDILAYVKTAHEADDTEKIMVVELLANCLQKEMTEPVRKEKALTEILRQMKNPDKAPDTPANGDMTREEALYRQQVEKLSEVLNLPEKERKDRLLKLAKHLEDTADRVRTRLDRAFDFCSLAFPQGGESALLAEELTDSNVGAAFIQRWGSHEYFSHNSNLQLLDHQVELLRQIETLDLEEYDEQTKEKMQ